MTHNVRATILWQLNVCSIKMSLNFDKVITFIEIYTKKFGSLNLDKL